jgi:hypothetical protein
MRQAVCADEEHTPLKPNMKDDLSITQEYLNTWKTKPYKENSQTLYRKKPVGKESSLSLSLSWFSAGYIYPATEGFCCRHPRPGDQNQKLREALLWSGSD